jgi:hypothetical protein
VPAAAVIPAPIAYIKVVAVKKLVVESVCHSVGSPLAVFNWHYVVRPIGGLSSSRGGPTNIPSRCSSLSVEVGRYVYFEQIRVLKAGYLRLNTVCME